jgi:outer membrane protein assembly factor BamB
MNLCQYARRPETRAMVIRRWAWAAGCLIFCAALRADTLPEATNLWTYPFPQGKLGLSTPAVGPDGTIYVGDFVGELIALAPDGKEQWRFRAGLEIKSSPAIADDGTIYFGSRNHQFYAVTPAGKLKWKFATGGWVDSSPGIAADGTVYFGSWDKNFYALNPDGSLKWKFPAGGIVDSSPAIAADGTIYFGAHNKKLYALDPDGKPRWTFLTGAEISSSPALGEDGSVYCSSTDGNLYRLKPDGTEVWRCRIGGGSASSPVLAENGNVIIGAAFETLAVSSAGAVVWRSPFPCWIDETAAAAQGTVIFSRPWRLIWARQPDGTDLWSGPVIENLSSSLVIGNHGELYCACGEHLQAVQPPVALVPAKSSWPMFRANARHTGRVASQ